MGEFLNNLMQKHKGNFFIMIVCSILSVFSSILTTNQTNWLQEDIELIVEHHIEEHFGLSEGTLKTHDIHIQTIPKKPEINVNGKNK
jgi:hypothetical protein